MPHTLDQIDFLQMELNQAISRFVQVAHMADCLIGLGDLSLEVLTEPHKPTSLPEGKMAVYGFYHMDIWLKVGKVGPNSKARYKSQHYLPNSTNSNLAKSILKDSSFCKTHSLDSDNIKTWMLANLVRFNILIDKEQPDALLSLLEAYLHLKLEPKFEGKLQ